MKKKVAILDLGTNTFHLLIAGINTDGTFNTIYKAEEFVKLGEDGLDRLGENSIPARAGADQEVCSHHTPLRGKLM
jgi:exopolyphosphatase/pppGpp-phosphohydrolase